MLRAGVGHSTAVNPANAASQATAAALKQAGIRSADGALVFASTAHGAAYHLLTRTVAETAGTPEVAGCSAAGVIAGENEIEAGPAVAVMVFSGLVCRRIFTPSLRGRGRETALDIAAAVRQVPGPKRLLCLFPDTYNFEPASFLETLERELPDGTEVIGGGATEDGTIGETFQFCGDTVSSNSVAGMAIGGDFELNLGASLACVPLGKAHRVSAVRDNVLIELDGRPAFEVFAETAGPLAADLRRAMAYVFLAIPEDQQSGRFERGRYSLRNIVGASAEHGVIAVAYRSHPGELVGFALREAERARNDLKLMLGEMRERTKTPPVFGFYFDCVSRGAGLYNIPGHDSAYIRQCFGDLPIAGFFTGFEIGPSGGKAALLQYSGVLATVSEPTN